MALPLATVTPLRLQLSLQVYPFYLWVKKMAYQANPGSSHPARSTDPIVVQALVSVGSGDVFAIGDANLWDGSDLDSNGKTNLEEYDNAQLALNVFAFGKQCTKCRWALFKDKEPWPQVPVLAQNSSNQTSASYNSLDLAASNLDWMDPNEQIMQNWDIPYTIFRSADIPSVDLTPYCKVIVASEQQFSFLPGDFCQPRLV